MKRVVLAAIVLGMLDYAQAVPITIISSGSTIDGVNAYEYLINSIPIGTLIASASITFNNVTLTTSGGAGDDISLDLINRHDATQKINDSDHVGDYWQTHTPYSSSTVALGAPKTFFAPYKNKYGKTIYDTESWTYTFSGVALTDLINDVYKYGYFDIGIDPDCIYSIGNGGVVLNYTVADRTKGKSTPDQMATAIWLGLSFAGLVLLRRRLCPA